MTFEQFAKLVGARAGACRAVIGRVAGLADAGEDAVVFAMDEKALTSAIGSRAGAILVSSKVAAAAGVTDERLLVVADARYEFAVAAKALRGDEAGAGVHASAVIGLEVTLGAGVEIGPHSVIGDGVRFGDGCRVGPNVTIYPRTVLGDRVVVQAGAVLGSSGFGYARNAGTGEYLLFPQQGTLLIEDDVEIGANTTIDGGALGETRIGRGTKIDNLVHIGHNCTIGRNVVIAAQTGISGSSVVEDSAILGGQVGIGEHATVGRGVILGGGSGVLSGKKMQGEGKVFWGRPARPLKEYLRDLARLRGSRKD
jgi:UDP-3-O-[3-hydroxymyristoyl] glucosamine N-acyltransferase